jgi:ComF family protein
MQRMAGRVWRCFAVAADALLSLLYPPRCAVCRALGCPAPLCPACIAAVVPVSEPACPHCGHALEPERVCRACQEHPPAFDRARALGAYQGVLREAVHRFKYRNCPALAEPLGGLLVVQARAQSAALHQLKFDGVLPMPMHAARRRTRGYNQSERLARVVARELGLSLDTALLTRARATRPQVGLSATQRRSNLQGAFRVSRPQDTVGKTFLLIDDVMTTGSSLSECATMLKLAGARGVYALVLATG